MHTVGTWWMWAGFFALVLLLLALDLFLLGGRRAHRVSFREAAAWSTVWIAVAVAFNGAMFWYLDGAVGRELASQRALEFFTGYLLEKSLAVDNVFVWLMLFGYFAVPPEFQRRVLLYGVLGAIVLRAAMILAGAWLVAQFHWLLYLFGAFLVVTGIKMLVFADAEPDLEHNPVLRFMRRHVRISKAFDGEHFFTRESGVRVATPLLLVLVLVEISDIVFAVDSIPAIFAVTDDPFILITSNIFAIMGLRAMYFLLAGFADRFSLLKYGLAIVLAFVGTKMLIADWVKIPTFVSLGVVAALLIGSMLLSLAVSRRKGSGPLAPGA